MAEGLNIVKGVFDSEGRQMMTWLLSCLEKRRMKLSAANFELTSSMPTSFRLRRNNLKRRV